MSKPDSHAVMRAVRELAVAYPDNVYKKSGPFCSYTEGECTVRGVGCIFGQALIKLGVHPGDFSGDIAELMDYWGIYLSARDAPWCLEVQDNQDRGVAWGAAVRLADEMMMKG